MTVVEERAAASGSFVRRRLNGTYTVDEWGLDRDLVEAASPLLGMRWQVEAIGADVLPARRPVLLVANCRVGWSEPFVLGRGIRLATGRFVRVAGVPDVAPVAPVLRRFGGVLARSDEVAGLLGAGEMVGVMLGQSMRRHRTGDVRADLLAPALATGADVVPVALIGREIGRRWKVVVGPAIEHPIGRGPLAAADLAERARRGVQSLLDDAFPPSLWQRLH
jgi:hypothetical protein